MVKSLCSICVLIGIVFTAYFYFDGTYAKAARLELVEMRLEQKIKQDRAQAVQERLWRIEDKYKVTGCEDLLDDVARQQCRELRREMKMLETNTPK